MNTALVHNNNTTDERHNLHQHQRSPRVPHMKHNSTATAAPHGKTDSINMSPAGGGIKSNRGLYPSSGSRDFLFSGHLGHISALSTSYDAFFTDDVAEDEPGHGGPVEFEDSRFYEGRYEDREHFEYDYEQQLPHPNHQEQQQSRCHHNSHQYQNSQQQPCQSSPLPRLRLLEEALATETTLVTGHPYQGRRSRQPTTASQQQHHLQQQQQQQGQLVEPYEEMRHSMKFQGMVDSLSSPRLEHKQQQQHEHKRHQYQQLNLSLSSYPERATDSNENRLANDAEEEKGQDEDDEEEGDDGGEHEVQEVFGKKRKAKSRQLRTPEDEDEEAEAQEGVKNKRCRKTPINSNANTSAAAASRKLRQKTNVSDQPQQPQQPLQRFAQNGLLAHRHPSSPSLSISSSFSSACSSSVPNPSSSVSATASASASASAGTAAHSSNFITEQQFLLLAEDYLLSLSPKKREKALLSNSMYQKILMVLIQPKNTQVSTAQFRFWAKKMFTLSTTPTHHVVCHGGKPVATKECLYDVLVYCHRKSSHGGRDKTSAEVRQHYSWVPKELIARFVKHCPLCLSRRCTQQRQGSNGVSLIPGVDLDSSCSTSPPTDGQQLPKACSQFPGQESMRLQSPDLMPPPSPPSHSHHNHHLSQQPAGHGHVPVYLSMLQDSAAATNDCDDDGQDHAFELGGDEVLKMNERQEFENKALPQNDCMLIVGQGDDGDDDQEEEEEYDESGSEQDAKDAPSQDRDLYRRQQHQQQQQHFMEKLPLGHVDNLPSGMVGVSQDLNNLSSSNGSRLPFHPRQHHTFPQHPSHSLSQPTPSYFHHNHPQQQQQQHQQRQTMMAIAPVSVHPNGHILHARHPIHNRARILGLAATAIATATATATSTATATTEGFNNASTSHTNAGGATAMPMSIPIPMSMPMGGRIHEMQNPFLLSPFHLSTSATPGHHHQHLYQSMFYDSAGHRLDGGVSQEQQRVPFDAENEYDEEEYEDDHHEDDEEDLDEEEFDNGWAEGEETV